MLIVLWVALAVFLLCALVLYYVAHIPFGHAPWAFWLGLVSVAVILFALGWCARGWIT